MISTQKQRIMALSGLIIAVSSYTWAAIFIRWAESADHIAIAFWRVAIAAIVWIPLFYMKRRSAGLKPLTKHQRKLIISAGLFLCFHFATWISSLAYTTVASASFLILLQPILIAIAAHLFLKERLNRWNLVAMVATIIGAGFIFGGDLQLSKLHLRGDILALLGAFGSTAYLFVARLARPDKPDGEKGISLLQYLPPVYLIAASGLLILCILSRVDLVGYSGKTWISLIGLGLIPTVIGHSLFNWAMRYLPAFTVNIMVVGEPLGASVLAYWLLSEIPSKGLLVGSILMVFSVFLVVKFPPILNSEKVTKLN